MKYLSLILAEKVIEILEESGATEVQKLAALDIARAIVPASKGSAHFNAEEMAWGFPGASES